VLFGLTFGRTDATSANSFFINLHAASNCSIVEPLCRVKLLLGLMFLFFLLSLTSMHWRRS